jgi:hypothetical protein
MREKTIDKLRKLIAHEESARKIGNEGEARVFASTIQEWLTRHKLSLEDVASEVAIDGSTEVGQEQVRTSSRRVYWEETLASAIAESNSCKTVITSYSYPGRRQAWAVPSRRSYLTRHSYSIWFVGEKADREICIELFSYLTDLAQHLANKEAEGNKNTEFYRRFQWDPSWKATRTKQFKQGFLEAFADEVGRRLRRARKNVEQEMPAASTAMVLACRTEQSVKEFIAEHYREGNKKETTRAVPRLGQPEGKKAGKKVALTTKRLS